MNTTHSMHRPEHLPFSPEAYSARLRLPNGRVHIVIDTDAANEIDDQFALAWALLHPERLQIHGIYATPFSFAHRRSRCQCIVGAPEITQKIVVVWTSDFISMHRMRMSFNLEQDKGQPVFVRKWRAIGICRATMWVRNCD
jgi:hypothetical protein